MSEAFDTNLYLCYEPIFDLVNRRCSARMRKLKRKAVPMNAGSACVPGIDGGCLGVHAMA